MVKEKRKKVTEDGKIVIIDLHEDSCQLNQNPKTTCSCNIHEKYCALKKEGNTFFRCTCDH